MWTALAVLLEITSGGVSYGRLIDPPAVDWAALIPTEAELLMAAEGGDILIIDETTPVATVEDLTAPDLGPATDLGPGSLNLQAMAALDATIAQLVEISAAAPSLALPQPFACDLAKLSDDLTQNLLAAEDEVLTLWDDLLETSGVNAMAQETEAEQCALTQAMDEALARATREVAQNCSPITLALRLTDTVARVRPNAQPKWARELSLLAQKQGDYTFLGRDPADLCPEYRALETAMQADIRG